MAKSKEKSNGYSFGNLQNLVENISKKTSITVERDRDDDSYISTGVYVMDALLAKSITKGGIPKNRITIFAGDPGTGKSYLCYNIARNAQKDGYSVIYIDTEYSANNETFKSFGVNTDPEHFMLLSSNNVEAIKTTLTQIINDLKTQKTNGLEIPKVVIFLDSIGNLASSKEINDAIEGNNKQDMTRAKSLKSMFRIISSDLGFLEIPLVMTNHIYMCLTAGHEILKSDGNYELIENLKVGDTLKTLDGDKKITKTVKYTKSPIFKITLENGQILKSTPNHKFLVKSNWSNDENADCWKRADELNENDIILAIEE